MASGHGHRHCETLRAIYDALRRVWGATVAAEPQNYRDYSDHRPDLTIMELALRVFDLKIFDPVGSDPSAVGMRGVYVAFGNTRPAAREAVLGLRERGVAGGAAFNPRTGAGYVAAKGGDYARAQRAGVAVAPLLIETFGGFGDDLRLLLQEAAAVRSDRLSTRPEPGAAASGCSSKRRLHCSLSASSRFTFEFWWSLRVGAWAWQPRRSAVCPFLRPADMLLGLLVRRQLTGESLTTVVRVALLSFYTAATGRVA